MTATPNVLKKPIGTKRIIATNAIEIKVESKRLKYDDNKIAERVPIEEVSKRGWNFSCLHRVLN